MYVYLLNYLSSRVPTALVAKLPISLSLKKFTTSSTHIFTVTCNSPSSKYPPLITERISLISFLTQTKYSLFCFREEQKTHHDALKVKRHPKYDFDTLYVRVASLLW